MPSISHIKNNVLVFLNKRLDDTAGLIEWDSLRQFGKQKIVQVTVVMPVLGYFILFSETLGPHLALVFDERPITPPRVYWLYYGFVFIALGQVIYSVACPKIIKQYAKPSDYYTERTAITTEGELTRFIGIMENNISKHPNLNDFLDKHQLALPDLKKARTKHQGEFADFERLKATYLPLFYRYMAGVRQRWAYATFFFYALGTLMVAWPSVEVFFQVTWYVLA